MIQLTNRSELKSRMGRDLTAEEDAVVDALIRDCTALIYAAAPRTPNSIPLPDAIIGVASRLVIDGLAVSMGGRTPGVTSERLADYSVDYDTSAGSGGGLALTDSMLQALKPWRKSALGTVALDPGTVVAW